MKKTLTFIITLFIISILVFSTAVPVFAAAYKNSAYNSTSIDDDIDNPVIDDDLGDMDDDLGDMDDDLGDMDDELGDMDDENDDMDDDMDDDENEDEEGDEDEDDNGDSNESEKPSYNPEVEGVDPEEKDTVYTDAEKTADENNRIAYQYCGDNMYWYIRNNTLIIFGKGKMYDYSANSPAPWQNRQFNSVVLRTGITYIGVCAFTNQQFKNITLPSTVKEIGGAAFYNNEDLRAVKFGKDMRTIGCYAFGKCPKLKDVVINNNLLTIDTFAFKDCTSLVSVRFSSTMHTLGDGAFHGCKNLTRVVLRTGLIKIGDGAFYECTSLAKINFPETLSTIGMEAFLNCNSLVNVTMPSSLNKVEARAFENCWNITSLTFYENLTNIAAFAFKGSGLRELTLPASLRICVETMIDDCENVTIYICKNANLYKKLSACKNATVICKEHDNANVGAIPATLTAAGRNACQQCKACGEFTNLKPIERIGSVSLAKTLLVYNGKAQFPAVKVTDIKNRTISSANYTVTYPKNPCAVGAYSAKVVFSGSYSGTKTLTYKIIPKGTSISKLTAGKKTVGVYWKKQATQTGGYDVQYSVNKNFAGAKTVTLKGNAKVAYSIKNLTSKKVCYVRVRTFKTVGSAKFCSSWSAIKNIKVK